MTRAVGLLVTRFAKVWANRLVVQRRHANLMVTNIKPDERNRMSLPSLPCYPCPYDASCCAYGATVTDEEAAAIEANHGEGFVYQTRWGEWRTRVRKKRCVFYQDGGCSIHD